LHICNPAVVVGNTATGDELGCLVVSEAKLVVKGNIPSSDYEVKRLEVAGLMVPAEPIAIAPVPPSRPMVTFLKPRKADKSLAVKSKYCRTASIPTPNSDRLTRGKRLQAKVTCARHYTPKVNAVTRQGDVANDCDIVVIGLTTNSSGSDIILELSGAACIRPEAEGIY
jgi:hypothetical protein